MGRQTSMFTRNILLLLLVFLSFLVLCLCSSPDTITFNQTLKDGDLLISNAKSFALGFFTPENSLGKRYLGIWYQQIPEHTVVWVANRDNPINGTTGILFLDNSGNLVIQESKTNIPVWNTSSLSAPTTAPKTYSAQLKDTGNLVLYHDPDRKAIKWQSFDYPTNTLLPFMKLGVDKKTGLNRVLSSWKSADDPSKGQYSFGLELNGPPQLFLYRSWARIWRTGPWNGVEPGREMSQNNILNLNYVENEDEVTVMWDPSTRSILVLNESGKVNRLTWQGNGKGWVILWSEPQDKCEVYARCGAFSNCNPENSGVFECSCLTGYEPRSSREWDDQDSTNGCWRNATDACHNGEGFMKLTRVKTPDAKTARVNRTIGLKECEELCLKNCSCTGYSSANVSDGGIGCFTWYGDLIDMREFQNGGQDMYIRVTASDLAELEKKSKGHNGKWVKVALVVVFVALAPLFYCLITKLRKAKRQPSNTKNTSLESYEGSAMGEYVTGSADVSIFDLKTIQSATDNFSTDNKLGQGGFGSVYKGKLQDGRLVAVKRLSRTSGQGIEEFKNEVTLIAKLQHRNLVRLLGCCIEQGEKMLVYEYLPNKALDSFIFDNRMGKSLDWTKRFEIILGIARGLLYLHRDSRLRIIHRDMKASNVLLDASMHPKISDFGMAKIFGGDQNEANTNRVVGTYGYMSPEYAMAGQFSVKSDVFSFGVLLLEIVSGRKNKTSYRENSLNLIGDVWDFWSEGIALDIVDPSLGESYDSRKALRCINVGLLCVQALPNDRPTMSDVVFMLCNESKLPLPNLPGFILKQENCNQPSFILIPSTSQSVNDMSITKIEGR